LEDRPLYLWARRLLRAAKGMKGREVRQRMIERPGWIEGRMEDRVPQFFLRNITRVERTRDEDEGLPFEEVRTRDADAEGRVGRALAGRFPRPELLTHWNLDDVVWLRALVRRYVYQEDWRRRFGRELKEHVRGPLFRYDPDKTEG
jgi:hypothetical protein